MKFSIRPIKPSDRESVAKLLTDRWGDINVVSRGRIYDASALPGYLAVSDGKIVGLITYNTNRDACEIVTLDSLHENSGIGTNLINTVIRKAENSAVKRLWLITINDNTRAIRFYQKRGFELVAIHRNAMEISRNLKPQIPKLGIDDIPVRDEIELEMKIQ